MDRRVPGRRVLVAADQMVPLGQDPAGPDPLADHRAQAVRMSLGTVVDLDQEVHGMVWVPGLGKVLADHSVDGTGLMDQGLMGHALVEVLPGPVLTPSDHASAQGRSLDQVVPSAACASAQAHRDRWVSGSGAVVRVA